MQFLEITKAKFIGKGSTIIVEILKTLSFLLFYLTITINNSSCSFPIHQPGITKYIKPKMIFVKEGNFYMGRNDGLVDEKPLHEVRLNSYYIGKYEVTFDEYDAFCEAMQKEKPKDEGWGRGKRPVINVSWEDATAYCKWLSKETGSDYRLPTEAEWEYAARGGIKSKGYLFAGSNTQDEIAWYPENCGGKTQIVGRKLPNELGIYDMSGNVWEWCNDWYGNYPLEPQINPLGPESGGYRVIRGSCWYFADGMDSWFRFQYFPDVKDFMTGFRLVKISRNGLRNLN